METTRVAWGLLILAVGSLSVRYARSLADFSEQLDAIGSKRTSGDVEAAEWKVTLYRLGAAGVCLVGLFLAVTGLL